MINFNHRCIFFDINNIKLLKQNKKCCPYKQNGKSLSLESIQNKLIEINEFYDNEAFELLTHDNNQDFSLEKHKEHNYQPQIVGNFQVKNFDWIFKGLNDLNLHCQNQSFNHRYDIKIQQDKNVFELKFQTPSLKGFSNQDIQMLQFLTSRGFILNKNLNKEQDQQWIPLGSKISKNQRVDIRRFYEKYGISVQNE